MSPDEVTTILTNRLTFISEQRHMAEARGDLAAIVALDEDAATTSATLAILQTS